MTTNMYRVGDYVYVETSSTTPYQIRRIDELNKTPNGNVEAKVMCFYRRRDLPTPLVQLADKHQMATSEDSPAAMKLKKMWLKTPVSEEQAAQAVLDPALVALEEERNNSPNSGAGSGERGEHLNPKQRHQMKQRELFLSRQVETLPATQIRGKCSVTLLNEEESLLSYLNKDDTFFYCLVFDPTQKTLLADKGEIRVGARYQTDLQQMLKPGEKDDRNIEELETLVWTPQHSLTDKKIDQFLVVSRSVGTFARALDCTSSVKQPSLHMSAAAASRDITLFHAMDTLHKHNYSIETAMCSLVPSSGPVLCRDEMEEWSASEANLFEDALDKYGKDFNDIRNDFLPWKTLKSIVEYYYMWKTTDRYVQQKRVKAVEAESKLKQVYIPNYTKPSPALITNNNKGILNGNSNGGSVDMMMYSSTKACESCTTMASQQWYSWGPVHLNNRLCQNCWNYWKRYGGLKVASRLADNGEVDPVATINTSSSNASPVSLKKRNPGSDIDDDLTIVASTGPIAGGLSGVTTVTGSPGGGLSNHRPHSPSFKCSIVNCGKEFKLKAHLARHYAQAHGIQIRSGSPRPIMKTRTAFYLHTTLTTRLSRRLCRQIIRSKKAARQPSYAINIASVKQEFANAEAGKSITEIRRLLTFRKKDRGSVTQIANRLGNPGVSVNEWLVLTPKENMPKPDVVAFPKPPKAPDGTLLYDRIPNKGEEAGAKPPNVVTTTPTTGVLGGAAALPGTVGGALSGKLAPLVGSGGLAVTPIVVGGSNSSSTTASTCSAVGGSAGSTGSTSGGVGSSGMPAINLHASTLSSNSSPSGQGSTTGSSLASSGATSLKRRPYEDANGIDATIAPPAKRPNKDPRPSHRPTPEQYAAMIAAAQSAGQPLPRHHMNGKPKIAQMARTGSGRKQVISWNDAPDDVFYRSTKAGRKLRREIPIVELRRAARKPWRNLHPKYSAIVAALLPVASTTPSLPAQLTAQLGHAAQLAANAVQHPTSANLNLNLNSAAVAAAAAALAGVHPLSAASTLALSGTLGGGGGGPVISPVGGVTSLSGGGSTGASIVSSGATALTNSSSNNNNSGSNSSVVNNSSSSGGGSGAVATDSNKSDLQVVILD
ncbi:metastasis-associated protein MTA1 [Anopheles funestus]|uniref:metastasis-associated protein MTA1 n=1 Tax=Anopheles funestus TaxID=62324 RepID=UPI0020C6ECB9|nr:metastasis-associated protein MTA1 [Anopheles funestus]XP_049277209.1 metastasis-associated protein MTA1 [Anopheles funestus]XP_049277210.1 metastasis-associated protein MTA1 [Anopheles funestus]XP_049277211.1 metastasis-associated protein MTA1 [Anopheles funestus]XP_049277212.1 metastasis-associated protein MTA1 [Anopheles funestus]XP_049277213.1 metastasis-associated protein MTA1 [Anopheles funestus]XP_049277214.1 metastasis-associated protein MTA1 [Anopheles funestus]XP_049277216.1 met